MLPNSISYCRAKPFKVLAAAPRPREKGDPPKKTELHRTPEGSRARTVPALLLENQPSISGSTITSPSTVAPTRLPSQQLNATAVFTAAVAFSLSDKSIEYCTAQGGKILGMFHIGYCYCQYLTPTAGESQCGIQNGRDCHHFLFGPPGGPTIWE